MGPGVGADAAQNLPKVRAGQGRAAYCLWALQLLGPPSNLAAWPDCLLRCHPQSPRDRRGLYFGGGCLIPRADPGLVGVSGCLGGPLPGGLVYVRTYV